VLVWTTRPPSRRDLRRDGYHVLDWNRLARDIVRVEATGTTRTSLRNPAARLTRRFARHARVALLGVTCGEVRQLAWLHGYVVEPAFRHGCTLLLGADRTLEDIAATELIDASWRHPWTRERLLHLVARYRVAGRVPVPVDASWRRRLQRLLSPGVGGDVASPAPPPPSHVSGLDPEQTAAVQAGDGVVQVIAPAGSGKTTVLIARVRELLARGTPARAILCLTFNRDACREIEARLARVGVAGVTVRSFHALGRMILQREGRLRPRLGGPSTAEWRQLARDVREAAAGRVWLDPALAGGVVSGYKLATMVTPTEAVRSADSALERAAADLYRRYEDLQAAAGRHDFDDLVAGSVALLQRDADVRRRWQARFTRVLVDEYQDTEPAQALLVGLLAAPQDSLFCVGDEDQCIYAWRRAAVERVIELDRTYPGLQRLPLVRNYRCGRRITGASRRLIGHNRRRFRKPLRAGAGHRGKIAVHDLDDRRLAARRAANLLAAGSPGESVVLARTASLLREVALACARMGVTFDTTAVPDGDVRPAGAVRRDALEAEDEQLLRAHRRDDGHELATVHGAKGREWSHVIIYGADQGLFPHAQMLGDPASLEDERRLFYVALTRAKERLDIVCTRGRRSCFVGEAGL
jgi:superfamily I DNA/RNA helicase